MKCRVCGAVHANMQATAMYSMHKASQCTRASHLCGLLVSVGLLLFCALLVLKCYPALPRGSSSHQAKWAQASIDVPCV